MSWGDQLPPKKNDYGRVCAFVFNILLFVSKKYHTATLTQPYYYKPNINVKCLADQYILTEFLRLMRLKSVHIPQGRMLEDFLSTGFIAVASGVTKAPLAAEVLQGFPSAQDPVWRAPK